jgi:protein-S-isoprenylcysteine O-methyltransferase Ste14
MRIQPSFCVVAVWAVLTLYWLYASRRVKKPRRRQPVLQRGLACASVGIVALLMLGGRGPDVPLLGLRVWPDGPLAGWMGVAVCCAGAAFAIRARQILADNWSAEVQVKERHALITQGPYAIVRHPIYTGVLMLLIGTWMLVGTLGALFGIAIGFGALWHKMMLEERFMREEFPAVYPLYAARVKRLIPGIF